MADWIWTRDDDASELTPPGGFFGDRMLRFAENQGTQAFTIGANSGAYWFSQPNQPGSRDWRVGIFRVRLYVTVANPNIQVIVGLFRYDGAGNPVESYGAQTTPTTLGSTGQYEITGTSLAQSAVPIPDASHRLRLLLGFSRIDPKGAAGITLHFGDPATDTLEVPITMAASRIVFNSINLDLPLLSGYRVTPKRRASFAMSDGVVTATSHRAAYDELFLRVFKTSDVTFVNALRAFWSWASRGKQYAFGLDSGDMVEATLNGNANAGQAVIPLSSTTGLQTGRSYLLREVAGPEMEVINILSISAGVSVTATTNLIYGYVSGDKLRSLDYYPKLVTADEQLSLVEEGVNWTFEHNAVEDRG